MRTVLGEVKRLIPYSDVPVYDCPLADWNEQKVCEHDGARAENVQREVWR